MAPTDLDPLIILPDVLRYSDAMWQTYAYWIMGALSNDPRKLAYMTGESHPQSYPSSHSRLTAIRSRLPHACFIQVSTRSVLPPPGVYSSCADPS